MLNPELSKVYERKQSPASDHPKDGEGPRVPKAPEMRMADQVTPCERTGDAACMGV
jgi:hypothetical protein